MSYWSTGLPSVSYVVADDEVLITLSGAVDAMCRETLKAALYVAMVSARNVTLDCDELAFVDVGTVMLLARTADHLADRGRALHLVNPRPGVRRLLATYHLAALVS